MIWMTWRQFRVQGIVAAAALAVLAVLLAVTGIQLAHMYDSSGLPACLGHGGCGSLVRSFTSELNASALYKPLFFAGLAVLYGTPALIGLFWGAPLIAREFEAGTYRLAWNQGVTRTRWLAVKLGLIGAAAMATTGLFSLMISWWASPIDQVVSADSGDGGGAAGFTRLQPLVFDARGIAPVAYAAFAFALGVAFGVLLRRTLPAMAAALASFAAVQIAWPNLVRPHLITPVRQVRPLDLNHINELLISDGSNHMTVVSAADKAGAWLLSNSTIGANGRLFTGPAPAACGPSHPFRACTAALARLHLRQVLTYQPASRFWAFQWYEAAVFLAAAIALAGFCFWWVRRRKMS
jgi:ABC-2 family transporter protein